MRLPSDMAGRPPKVSDKDILRRFVDEEDPVLTAAEVAAPFDVQSQTIYKRLEDLADRGLVEFKKPGQSAKVYWITDDGRDFLNFDS